MSNINTLGKRIHIEIDTDDDFTINGEYYYDGYLDLNEGEDCRTGFQRWLTTILVNGYKAEAAEHWLHSLPANLDRKSGGRWGGNWECFVTPVHATYESDVNNLQDYLGQMGYDVPKDAVARFLKEHPIKVS